MTARIVFSFIALKQFTDGQGGDNFVRAEVLRAASR